MGILQYLPDEGDIGAAVHWYGEVLQGQLDLLARYIGPGMTVLEAGAGIGAHALALAGWVGPPGHVLLYESRPVVRRILQQNLAANRVRNVTVMRRALGRGDEAAARGSGAAPTMAASAAALLLRDRKRFLRDLAVAPGDLLVAGDTQTGGEAWSRSSPQLC